MSEQRSPNQRVDAQLLEQLRAELERSPTSRVFAPLADGYLKLGQLENALRVAQLGVLSNPEFATGRVVLGRILMESQKLNDALIHLREAVRLAPDHRMAQLTLGELHLMRREPREALNAFKMALLLNPNDSRALDAVRRWEFLTAGDFSDEIFAQLTGSPAQLTLDPNGKPENLDAMERTREVERALSLADAWTIRHDPERALETLRLAHRRLGPEPKLQERIELIESRYQLEADDDPETTEILPVPGRLDNRRQKLEWLLARIERYRREVDPSSGIQDSGGSLA